MLPTLVITSGEPAGIGPDICLTLMADTSLQQTLHNKLRLVVLGDETIFNQRARLLNLLPLETLIQASKGLWSFHAIPMPAVALGQAHPDHAPGVLSMINHAVTGCLSGEYAGMITAPIQKSSIINAGFPTFQGHTEYLAELCAKARPNLPAPHPLMMLTQAHNSNYASHPLRVCLLTTHLPLSQVPALIANESFMLATAEVVARDLQQRYGIERPVVAVLGLNPHAGEDGKIGDEEIRFQTPFINTCRVRFPQVTWEGPLSADTAFIPSQRKRFDAYLGCYHDQVLPVFKALSFGGGVNVTLGLPIIRTSVDHGTALSLAGTGKASAEGLMSALMECIYLSNFGASR